MHKASIWLQPIHIESFLSAHYCFPMKHSTKNKFGCVLFLCLVTLLIVPAGYAGQINFDLRTDRYVIRATAAAETQLMPLNQVVSIRFDESNVRQAIDKVLGVTGYRFLFLSTSSPMLAAMLTKPLAATHRRFKRIRIIQILHALAGPAFLVLIDPANRLVSFELDPDYLPLTEHHAVEVTLD